MYLYTATSPRTRVVSNPRASNVGQFLTATQIRSQILANHYDTSTRVYLVVHGGNKLGMTILRIAPKC